MLSNLQFNLIFSMLKKYCKNKYIFPSDICLSDIITSSRISLIISSIEDFFSHKKIESYPSIHIIWWKTTLFRVILIEIEEVHYFWFCSIKLSIRHNSLFSNRSTPWKKQRTKGFLVFTEYIKWIHELEMGEK